jgi:hypothetical protein
VCRRFFVAVGNKTELRLFILEKIARCHQKEFKGTTRQTPGNGAQNRGIVAAYVSEKHMMRCGRRMDNYTTIPDGDHAHSCIFCNHFGSCIDFAVALECIYAQ